MNKTSTNAASFKPVLRRTHAVFAGFFNLAFAAFGFFFYLAVILLLIVLPGEGVRRKVAGDDLYYRQKLEEIDLKYRAALAAGKTGARRAAIKSAYAEALRNPPHIRRMPVWEAMTGARIYAPSFIFASIAILTNVLLAFAALRLFLGRPSARRWLRRVAVVKLCGIAAGLALYVFVASGPVLEMLRSREAAHRAVYEARWLPVPGEVLLAREVFTWVFVVFVAVMLVWPVWTLILAGKSPEGGGKIPPENQK